MTNRDIERELENYKKASKTVGWITLAEIVAGLLTAGAAMYFFVYAIETIINTYLKKSYGDAKTEFSGALGKAILFLFLALIGAGIVYVIHRAGKLHQEESAYGFKKLFVEQAAEGLFDSYSYEPSEGFSRSEIKETGLVKTRGLYKSGDLVKGSCKSVAFRRADVALKDIFTGLFRLQGSWSVFDFNKEFASDLQIVTKNFKAANTHSKSVRAIDFGSRHKVETENAKFNERFSCYCHNDAEAFYLLTPRLMEALLEVDLMLGYPIMIGFVGNKLHFVIHSGRNYFEPESVHFREEIEKIRCELKAVRFIIDALSIDEEVFTVRKKKKK